MEAGYVIELSKLLEQRQIRVVVGGGWGVDALLGHQTRPHEDLDIAIEHKDVSKLRKLLARKGYKEVAQPDNVSFQFCSWKRAGTKIGRAFLHV